MKIWPAARIPDKWVAAGRAEGAHLDPTLKSPWQYFVAFDEDEPGGFVGLLLVSGNRAHIRGWYVFPEHRGKALGGRLLERAIAWADAHGIETLDIRTSHNVTWAGFRQTGYQRTLGNQEHQYLRSIPIVD